MRLEKIIYEINGKDTFFKVKNNSFGIEKVIFSFVKYDTKTNKAQQFGDFYMDFGRCLALCRDIDKGILQRDAKAEAERCKANNERYCKPIRQYQGGVSEEKAKRADKMAIARVLTIEPGNKAPFIMKFQEGPGKTAENKLITPKWWGDRSCSPDFTIMVPVSEEDMVRLALLMLSHINGHITSNYMSGAYMVDYDGKQGKEKPQYQGKQAAAPSTTTEKAQPQTNGRKPHTTVKPVVSSNSSGEIKQTEGETSERKYMTVVFQGMPKPIEGTNGLYYAEVKIKDKDWILYFLPDTYKSYKDKISQNIGKQITISYVTVKSPSSDEQFTYLEEM